MAGKQAAYYRADGNQMAFVELCGDSPESARISLFPT